MKKHLLIFISFFLLMCTVSAQNKQTLDSLNKAYKQAKNDTTQLFILTEIAKQYRQSFPDTALFLANKGLIFAKKIKYDRGIAINLNILGIVELTKGNYLQSITHLFEGLEINKKINNQKDISTNLNNIGEVYRLQENYTEAIKYYDEALKINENISYREGVAIILNNLGEIYAKQGKYEDALTYLFQSLKICEEIKNESRAALRLNNIGEIYAKQKKYTEALKSFDKAIEMSKKFNDKLHITREFDNVALIYLQMNNFNKSLEYAKQSLEIAKQINAKKEIAISLQTISNIYKKSKDYNNALTYYQLFVAYQDSLNNEEVTKKVKEIQFNYAMNQKEKEIKLLEIEKTLREKDAYNQFIYSIFFAVCILFLIIFAAGLFQKNNLKKKANDILQEKNKTTESQKEELQKTNDKLLSNETILKKAYGKIKESEVKIKEQNLELFQQKEELASINESLENTFKELKSTSDRLGKSIEYANQIQQLILPKKAKLDSFFTEHFSLYLPKDIVSGDFYWFTLLNNNKAVFVLADCTGHGVPGAFMTMIGNTLLHEIIKVKNINSPAEILLNLHYGVRNVLKQKESKNSDGMDIAICLFEKNISNKNSQVTFAGAKSNLFYKKDNLIIQLDGDKASIGGFTEKERIFTNQTFTLQEGEMIYFTSDGYIDQNNVIRARFGSSKFKELLNTICELPICEQKQSLLLALKEHQQNELQRDDISVVGIKL